MTSRVRFSVALLFLLIGIVLHLRVGIQDAWYLYLASVLLAATHFWFGNIWPAFAQLQKGNLLKAEILLAQTRYPNFLLKRPRAYYYLTNGIITMQQEDLDFAQEDLEQALILGLRTATDTALANLNLAHIHYKKQAIQRAKHYLEQAKQAQSNDLLIKQGIADLEKVLH